LHGDESIYHPWLGALLERVSERPDEVLFFIFEQPLPDRS
jgi:hypothetical protein